MLDCWKNIRPFGPGAAPDEYFGSDVFDLQHSTIFASEVDPMSQGHKQTYYNPFSKKKIIIEKTHDEAFLFELRERIDE